MGPPTVKMAGTPAGTPASQKKRKRTKKKTTAEDEPEEVPAVQAPVVQQLKKKKQEPVEDVEAEAAPAEALEIAPQSDEPRKAGICSDMRFDQLQISERTLMAIKDMGFTH